MDDSLAHRKRANSLDDLGRDALTRVIEPFERARPLPRRTFVDAPFHRLDQEIFRSSWIPVAHGSELASPGAFVVTPIADERVAVVRGGDLALSAFLDGCIHRGTPLFDEEAGRLPHLSITCPYHGLRYDLRGVAEPASCPSLRLPAGARLRPLRVVERFGFVFVCMDDATEPFDAWVGAVPPAIERASMHALRLGRRVAHEIEANWKLVVANFQESHHFTLVHPSLEARTPWRRSTSVDLGGAFLGGTMELSDDAETVSDVPSRQRRPFVAAPEDRRIVHDALLVPGWMTSLQPDYFLSYRLLPTGPRSTRIIADIYFHAEAFGGSFDPSAVYSFWDRTNAEDREICVRQQRGLASPSFELGPYAEVEDGVHAFERRIARAYLRRIGASE